jgi:hypothetical protein
LGFRGAPPTLVHVIQHDVYEKVCGVIDACTLYSQRSQLFGQSVPAKELPNVNVTNFQSTDVLERIEWDGTIKGELLVAFDQSGSSVWSKSEAGDFGEGGV